MSRRQQRQRFITWLRSFAASSDKQSSVNRPARMEHLEGRALMAGDTFLPLLGSIQNGNDQPVVGTSTSGLVAEGEAAPDLVAFAKALRDSGTQMFGAYWCPHCLAQKELFQDGAQFLPYVEVTDSARNPNQIAVSENITQYPTWEFPDGSRLTGEQTLETLAAKAGVAIPQASKPSFTTIPATSVEVGSPFHVPVNAYDPNGNPLTITVTSSNPNVVGAEVLSGNRSMRVRVKDFGDMVFQLFEQDAPVPTARIIELAQANFYNNIKFHRVINNFMIQTGDPLGTGAGGSTLGDIDDQFNVNLQHNRSGVLSYAKSTDDTNDSQFFITEVPTRHLDFNHSVFGQLIEGDSVREAISNVLTNSSDKPTIDIVIESVTIFNDTENGLIRLKANAASGTSNITVTVTDSEGESTSQTFVATVTPDSANGAPFLNPIADVSTSVNTPVTINLTSQDAENNPVVYSVEKVGTQDYTVSVNASTGVVTFTPPAGYTGTLQFRAKVQQTTTPTTADPIDSQLITVTVGGAVPTGVDLDSASDSGSSNSDNITNATNPTFTVTGTTNGAIVKLKVGNTVIGQATATGSTTTVTANNIGSLGQGAVTVVATQTISGVESAASPGTSVTFDATAPAEVLSSLIPSSAQVGQALSLNLAHAEEGAGLAYALDGAPTGMTIDAATGAISWTPAQAQLGAQAFNLKLTDKAGNVTTQAVSINVIEQPQAKIILQAVDMQGNPITQIATGQQFKIRFLTQDVRGFDAKGVFGAYIDLLFDPNIIEPIATNPITHTAPFTNGISPTSQTPSISGVINELGGFSSNLSVGDGTPALIAEVTFTAKAAGNANIRSEAADVGGNDILLFDATDKIPLSKVDFGSVALAVGANFQVANDAYNFDEDSSSHSLNVLANDTTSGGAVLTISAVGTASGGGTVTIAADGKTLNYTPAANFNGAETFTYTARNQDNVTLVGTVTVQVADVNDPPVAVNDVATVNQNSTSNVITVLSNDTTGNDAPASETLRVSAVGTPSSGGSVQLGSSGLNILYTPKPGFLGTETVTYTLSDGRGGTSTGTVSITVKVANPPPVAVADSFTVVEDAAEASFDVIANDTTDAGETLTISAVGTSTKGSTLKISTDSKKVLYKPGPNVNGTEVLTYTLKDSGGATAVGTITFTITAVNDAPNAVDDTLDVLSTAGVQTIQVLTNDVNPDSGETLTITAVTQPAAGTGSVAISSDGRSIRYTPPSNTFAGTASFSYTLSDGSTLTDSAAVTLNVKNYVPRSIGGVLYASSGSNASSALPYGGVDMVLSGQDSTGANVNVPLSSDSSGSFSKSGLAPGTYTITRPALPFLEDHGDTITVTSAPSDSNNTSLRSAIGGLKAQYIGLRSFLGSAAGDGLTVAVKPGADESWYTIRGNTNGFSNIKAQLNAAATSLVVTAKNSSNQNVSATLPLSGSTSRISVLGMENDARLLKVRGNLSALGFQVVTGSTTSSSLAADSGASGEGEGPGQVAGQGFLPAGSQASMSSLAAEGEAAPEVSAAPASGSSVLTPSQAIRHFLGSSQATTNPTAGLLTKATTQLPPSAVDQAISEIDTLSLAASDVDALTSNSGSSHDEIDSALAAL
ncbi:MAG: Ig-like domain-containing protein [Aureliella sp.]